MKKLGSWASEIYSRFHMLKGKRVMAEAADKSYSNVSWTPDV